MSAGDSAVSGATQSDEEAVQQGAAQQAPTPDSTDSYVQSVLFITLVTAGLILLFLTAAVLFMLKTRRGRRQGGSDEKSTVSRHLAVRLAL